MKISFCVTYYNQKDFVQQSLDSIFSLNLPFDYEILVGDDGSKDGTIESIKSYQKEYLDKIKLFIMPREPEKKYNPIHRASANRLNLIKNSSGEYICFLDGDDFYSNPDFATKAVSVLDKNLSLVGCAFNFEYVLKEKKEPYKHPVIKEGIVDTKEYIKKDYIHSGAILFRNIFDANRIKILENSQNFDDNLITIYMLKFGSLYYIDEIAYSYYQVEGSIWNSASETEQNLLNAMDYEIISRVVPEFKQQILKRQFAAVKSTFKNRKNMKNLLGPVLYKKYMDENTELGNSFICSILNWINLSFSQKMQLVIQYVQKYISRKTV